MNDLHISVSLYRHLRFILLRQTLCTPFTLAEKMWAVS